MQQQIIPIGIQSVLEVQSTSKGVGIVFLQDNGEPVALVGHQTLWMQILGRLLHQDDDQISGVEPALDRYIEAETGELFVHMNLDGKRGRFRMTVDKVERLRDQMNGLLALHRKRHQN